MEIKEIDNKEIWEDFINNCSEKTFLHSWNWGEVQKKLGNKIWRFGMYKNNNIVAVCLLNKVFAKRGNFLLIQHGPIISDKEYNLKNEIINSFISKFKDIGKKEKCNFIRIAPLLKRDSDNDKLFKGLGFLKSPMHANAYEATWVLNTFLSDEDIFKNMRKTTRYLIRQAMKNNDIRIIKSEKIEDVKIYQSLIEEVSKYHKFVPFSFDLVKNEFEIFLKDKQALLFLGEYKKEIGAAALIIFWSGIAFYHQGALSLKYHKIPISYVLQWEIIKEAKKRNCKLYDFWGYVDPYKQPKHPWAGPALFKMGFGGYKKEYLKTYDLPISFKYPLIFIFECLRKIKRGL